MVVERCLLASSHWSQPKATRRTEDKERNLFFIKNMKYPSLQTSKWSWIAMWFRVRRHTTSHCRFGAEALTSSGAVGRLWEFPWTLLDISAGRRGGAARREMKIWHHCKKKADSIVGEWRNGRRHASSQGWSHMWLESKLGRLPALSRIKLPGGECP